jgi:hypothetical protein
MALASPVMSMVGISTLPISGDRFRCWSASFHGGPGDQYLTETDSGQSKRPGTFEFLDFTHYWGRSRNGYWVVKRKTASNRLSRAPGKDCRVVSEPSTRAGGGAAPNTGAKAAWPLRVLRHHMQRRSVAAVPARGGAYLAQVAIASASVWAVVMAPVYGVTEPVPIAARRGSPLGVPSRRPSSDLTSRMPESGKSGSVGALGEQLPRATRPHAYCVSWHGHRVHPVASRWTRCPAF